jgi:hypothetical protein
MTSPAIPGTRSPGRVPWLAHRWPTLLAVVMTGVLALDGAPSVSALALALLLLPLGYLVMAVLRRRRLTWPVVMAGIGLVIALRAQTLVDPASALVVISLGVLALGVLRRSSRRDGDFHLQIAGLALFSTLALVAMAVHPPLATVLVAAGWFGHGVWDLFHLVRNRVVAPSFAEWCGVFDIGVAVQLLLLL